MKVCVDASPAAHQRAGLARYAAGMTAALIPLLPAGSLSVFVHHPRAARLPPALAALPRRTWPFGTKPWRLRALLSHFGGPSLDRAIHSADVFHATEHLLPRLTRARSVMTVHDLAFLKFPEHHLPLNRWFLQLGMPRFLAHAEAVIAVSEATRRDVLQAYRLPATKVHVVPEGVEPRFQPVRDPEVLRSIRHRLNLPERFVLTVGTLEPRKNVGTLLEAYGQIACAHSDVGLVIAGRQGWLYQDFLQRLRRSGLDSRVRLTGYVDDHDLPALLSAAEAFAYPSVFEGFGLPPLEAMACGTPVVCSQASSLPEVVGDAGLLLPPDDPPAWAQALERLLSDPALRAEYSARGQARAAQFTWEEAARQTLAVYRSIRPPTNETTLA